MSESSATPKTSLRERNKKAAMVAIQSAALELFAADGFANVTMNAIAERAGVGVATVYRYFGTKEGLAIWSENEDLIFDEIRANLTRLPPVAAVRAALVAVAPTFETDANLELARLTSNEPAIAHATSLCDREAAIGLASAFREHDPEMSELTASAVAGACLRALETALELWQASDTPSGLTAIIEAVFSAIGENWQQP